VPFERDAAFVRRHWHADLAGNENPGAGVSTRNASLKVGAIGLGRCFEKTPWRYS
jgi:hypothetical protein